jgi:hypothetical protein
MCIILSLFMTRENEYNHESRMEVKMCDWKLSFFDMVNVCPIFTLLWRAWYSHNIFVSGLGGFTYLLYHPEKVIDPVREVIHPKVMISTTSLIILLIPIMIFSLKYLRKIKCTLKNRENNRTNLLFNVTVEPFHLYSWRSRNLSKPKTKQKLKPR